VICGNEADGLASKAGQADRQQVAQFIGLRKLRAIQLL